MKKIIYLALVVVTIFIGCKKDAESTASILGKWDFKTIREKKVF